MACSFKRYPGPSLRGILVGHLGHSRNDFGLLDHLSANTPEWAVVLLAVEMVQKCCDAIVLPSCLLFSLGRQALLTGVPLSQRRL